MDFDLSDLGPGTAALYVRLSQDRNGTSLGIQRQEKEARDLARRMGLEVSAVYADNDVSATSGKVRPAFEQMLAERPEAIIAWHQDRLLRLTSDLERVIALNIPVYTVTAGTLDLSNPAGQAVARTVAAWSTYETQQKALRQKAANKQRAEAGHWHFSRRPYGYERRDGRVEVIEAEAEVVREAYRRYVAGESYYAIANDFEAREVPTFGGGWSMKRVRQILRNPRYAGIVEYNGRPVEVAPEDLQWQPLIDRRTWDDYLATREGRTRKGTWSSSTKHLMSGLALCGICGARMLARPDRGRTVYSCQAKWCTSRGAADVDAMVEAVVLARLTDAKVLRALRKAPDVAPLVDEIADLRKRRDDVGDLLAEGLLSKVKARETLTDLNARIERLTRQRDALRREGPLTDLALAASVPDRWADLPVLAKRRAITELGLRVYVDPAKRGPGGFDPRTVRLEWAD